MSPSHREGLAALRRLGVELIEVELDPLPYSALTSILFVESAAVFEELISSGRAAGLIAPWADGWNSAQFLSAVDYLQIERLRRQVMIMMDRIFDRVDVLVAPTYGDFDLLVATNMTGHPGLSFRTGFTQSAARDLTFVPVNPTGRPHRITTNLSMHGRLFEEGKMLALARAVEEQLHVWQQQPLFE